jgi:hypothetical protein
MERALGIASFSEVSFFGALHLNGKSTVSGKFYAFFLSIFFGLFFVLLGGHPLQVGFLCIFLACCFGQCFYIRGKPETLVIKVKAGPLPRVMRNRLL